MQEFHYGGLGICNITRTEGLRVRDAIDAFLRFTDKPITALKEAVSSELAQACLDGLRGIGRGHPNLSRNWISTFNLGWKSGPIPLSPDDQAFKAMRGAKQLGLRFEINE